VRRKRTFVGLTLLGLLLTLLAGCAGEPGQVELSATEYDFGAIPNTKPVSEVFEVHNIGRGQLEIAGVSTSCGCTTAEVGKRQLAPGEAAELVVTYDPQAHGGATGQFTRIVYVRTDDPDVPEATLTIRVQVTEP
jgi:hypothetical protein